MAVAVSGLKKINMLKNLFRKKEVINHEVQFAEWLNKGKPNPPPHIVKQKAIDEYRDKYNLTELVETGTYLGDMVEAQRKNFQKIYSIELSEKLFLRARKRFNTFSQIEILQGDSGQILHELIKKINSPALFWLDGHYSEGITAKGDKECPVVQELDAILKSNFDHVILIDDARMFNGKQDYPSVEEIKSILQNSQKKISLEVKDDIIRITPNNL
jgi:hypothetical protein